MGEVYRAKDYKLGREVALKVLPEHFADDEERLRRFEREAKTLASLNHPNVAQTFGIDQVSDTCFLVLELVPGESLEERLRRGLLPIERRSRAATGGEGRNGQRVLIADRMDVCDHGSPDRMVVATSPR